MYQGCAVGDENEEIAMYRMAIGSLLGRFLWFISFAFDYLNIVLYCKPVDQASILLPGAGVHLTYYDCYLLA